MYNTRVTIVLPLALTYIWLIYVSWNWKSLNILIETKIQSLLLCLTYVRLIFISRNSNTLNFLIETKIPLANCLFQSINELIKLTCPLQPILVWLYAYSHPCSSLLEDLLMPMVKANCLIYQAFTYMDWILISMSSFHVVAFRANHSLR